jgi:starch synthase
MCYHEFPMKIVFLASEAAPYAKTGGLADVAASLAQALALAGHEVKLFLPYYRTVESRYPKLPALKFDRAPAGQDRFTVREDQAAGVAVYFVEKKEYFDRDRFYGPPDGDYPDNGERFAFFCRAVLETLKALDFAPEILHAHDWQTAPALAYLKFGSDEKRFFQDAKSVFTIHNLAYQGVFESGILARIGLPDRLFRMEALEFFGRVNYLKAGILYADAVTTVSPRYAREIQTPEFGCGLDGLLRVRSGALRGILNGIDETSWNPSFDTGIAARYGPEDLSGKAICKAKLRKIFGFPSGPPDSPLIGMVSRLAGQKGFDLLVESFPALFAREIRLVVLGTGETAIEEGLKRAQKRFPLSLGLRIAYDDPLARKILAGSDMFLIPSRYEPCGLTQMYCQKYGSVPIVRATGGLDDTVDDFRPETGFGTGFKFEAAESRALVESVRRAVRAYRDRPLWKKIIRAGMTRDFSWRRSGEAYLELYRSLRV